MDLTSSQSLSRNERDPLLESAQLHRGWICLPLYLSHLLLNAGQWTKTWNLQSTVPSNRNICRLIRLRYLTLNLAYYNWLLCHANEIYFSFTACMKLIQTAKSFGNILCLTAPYWLFFFFCVFCLFWFGFGCWVGFFWERGGTWETVDDFSVEYFICIWNKWIGRKGVCLSISGFWGVLFLINKTQTAPESSVGSLLNIQNKKWVRIRIGSEGGKDHIFREENKAAMAFLLSFQLP